MFHALALGAISTTRGTGESAAQIDSSAKSLLGSWHTAAGLNSIVLSLEDSGEALFMFIEGGSYSISRTKWKFMPGGILVQNVPRLRLWAGRSTSELRAEWEQIPGLDVSKGVNEFPSAFFMGRVETRAAPPEMLNRPLPAGWEKSAPGAGWDQQAGKRRG